MSIWHGFHIVNKLISALNTSCYQICVFRSLIDQDTLLSFYYSQIESRLSYGICFWGSGSMINDVFISQKRVVRCIAGVDRRTSCRAYFVNFKLLTVCGLYFMKLLELVHSNILDFNKNSDFHSYDTRFKDDLTIPLHHLSAVGRTHKVLGLKLYNSLPGDIRTTKCLRKFRKSVKNILIQICPYTCEEARVALLALNNR